MVKAQFLLTVVAIAALGISLYCAFQTAKPAAGEPTNPNAEEIARLSRRLDEIAQTQKRLEDHLDGLQTRGGTAQAATPVRLSQKDIDEAVSRWMAQHGDSRPAQASTNSKEEKSKPDLRVLLAELEVPDLSEAAWTATWKKINAAGLTDAAVEAIEERAEANPNSPDLQVLLGGAYLEKLQTVPDGPEKGTFGMKADRSFDKALKLDDHHWDARFAKATSLSFWPPVFGKQGEAIKHFETLVEQQESSPPKSKFAQTYLFLGNMYQQQGKTDLAKQSYERGLKFFPDSDELKKQVAILSSPK